MEKYRRKTRQLASGLPNLADTRVWYNRQRRHSALAYQPPVAFEEVVVFDPAA